MAYTDVLFQKIRELGNQPLQKEGLEVVVEASAEL